MFSLRKWNQDLYKTMTNQILSKKSDYAVLPSLGAVQYVMNIRLDAWLMNFS